MGPAPSRHSFPPETGALLSTLSQQIYLSGEPLASKFEPLRTSFWKKLIFYLLEFCLNCEERNRRFLSVNTFLQSLRVSSLKTDFSERSVFGIKSFRTWKYKSCGQISLQGCALLSDDSLTFSVLSFFKRSLLESILFENSRSYLGNLKENLGLLVYINSLPSQSVSYFNREVLF